MFVKLRAWASSSTFNPRAHVIYPLKATVSSLIKCESSSLLQRNRGDGAFLNCNSSTSVSLCFLLNVGMLNLYFSFSKFLNMIVVN